MQDNFSHKAFNKQQQEETHQTKELLDFSFGLA